MDRLLARPPTEDPAFLLVFDGLNQNPTFPWASIARIAQGETCRRGVRIVFTVRTSYLEKQREFQPLTWSVSKVPVGQYTSGQGNELEQALAAHGLDPATLHRSLLDRTAVPRILPLIARLKGSLALQSEATVHRILWEYALDEYKNRADPSFSNEEFAEWVVSQADRWREARAAGKQPGQMSHGQLLSSLDASSRSGDDVDRKLSDLVDGFWVTVEGGLTRKFQPSRDALSLGLAISLLEQLKSSDADTPEALRDELKHWLEPIVAFDETSEVVRTALSILAKGPADPKEGMIASALMGAWLYAQNPTPDFEADVLALGSQMPSSILDAMEEPTRLAHTHAFDLGAQALRRVPLGNAEDWSRIEDRLAFWCARLVCPRPEAVEKDEDGNAAHDANRLRDRIGTAEPGSRTVLGVPVQIDYGFDTNALRIAPAVLEGHRLDRFKRVFVAAAVAMAVRSSHFHLAWTGLRALTSFALEPTPKLRDALRQWSAELAARPVEDGVNPILAARAAALLLWAAGEEADDLKAIELNPGLERHFEYATDYEADPGNSMFALEHRHFEQQLVTQGIALTRRLERARKFIADPHLAMPPSALADLERAATSFDIGDMDLSSQRTGEELAFGDLAPGLARFAPAALSALISRRLDLISKADAQTKYWGALRAREFLLLATPAMADAIGKRRASYKVDDAREERVANTWLLQVEIAHLTAEEQLKRISDVDALLTIDLLDVVRPGGEAMVRTLLSATESNEHTLCLALGYMAEAGRSVDASLIELMVQCLANANERVRTTAVIALHANAPDRLFQALHDVGWSANPKEHFEAHYGSLAYANHGKHLPFEDVAADIAPWCLLEAARCRGGAKAEFEQAIEIIDRILERSPPQAELVGDVELVNEGEHRPTRMRFNQAKREEPFDWSQPRRSAREVNQQQRTFQERMSQRINELRAQGAHLLLQDVKKEGVAAAWAICPDAMRRWLDGVDNWSREFVARLHSADGLYFALCEVLLKEEPALGAKLWRALRRFLPGRFAGPGGVSALVLMVFKVPQCVEVEGVRMELLDPSHCRSDLDLLDLVVAARMERAESWLAGVARSEAVAEPQWRRKRAILLLGMLEEPAVDAMKWPAGEPRSNWAKLRDDALIWANRATLARHWWHQFLVASDAEKAYAAFTVFLSCADRRALSWMRQDLSVVLGKSDLDHLKWSHWWLNRDMILRVMKKREEDAPKLAGTLCGQERPNQWLAMDGLTFA